MVISGWYVCPVCGKRIQKIEPDSIILNTALYCRNCKVDWFPSIYLGKEMDEDTPVELVTTKH